MFKGRLEVVMFGFMKSIHIQLSYKTVHFVVPEIFRKDYLLKFSNVLNGELCSVRRPIDDLDKIVYLISKDKYAQNLKCLSHKPCHLLLVILHVLVLTLALHLATMLKLLIDFIVAFLI
jgi:hypothetical protein